MITDGGGGATTTTTTCADFVSIIGVILIDAPAVVDAVVEKGAFLLIAKQLANGARR